MSHASCFSSAIIRSLGCECAGLPSQELKRPALGRTAGWWAKAPLSARVVLITDGNLPFVALGLPHTILCMVFEWPPLHLFCGISCGVPRIGSSIPSFRPLLYARTTIPPFILPTLIALSPLIW
jgi:hypothetical protein